MLDVCFSSIVMERGKILPRLENTHPDFVASAHYVDLANAADISLQTLLMACEPAPFGIDNKDVLDDTYRKAWKMDKDNFSTRLDVVHTRILDRICLKLMRGNVERKIRSELYKLNIYGE